MHDNWRHFKILTKARKSTVGLINCIFGPLGSGKFQLGIYEDRQSRTTTIFGSKVLTVL